MKGNHKFNIKGFVNKKENVAILALVVIFGAGIIVNNVKANNIPLHDGDILVDSENVTTEKETTETKDNTFDEQRAALDLNRNELVANLDNTIKESDNEAEKKNALKEKEKLTSYMENEVAIEGIITSKNLPESLVIITDNTVTVTVNQQELKQNTVAKICNIIIRTADKIVIQSSY